MSKGIIKNKTQAKQEDYKKTCESCAYFKNKLGPASPCPFVRFSMNTNFTQQFSKKWNISEDWCSKFE